MAKEQVAFDYDGSDLDLAQFALMVETLQVVLDQRIKPLPDAVKSLLAEEQVVKEAKKLADDIKTFL